MEDKIIWEWDEAHKFFKVHCTEGHYMTEWTDDRTDYENFNDARTMYTGTEDKKDKLRCISDEEHDRLAQLREERCKELEEERRRKEETK